MHPSTELRGTKSKRLEGKRRTAAPCSASGNWAVTELSGDVEQIVHCGKGPPPGR